MLKIKLCKLLTAELLFKQIQVKMLETHLLILSLFERNIIRISLFKGILTAIV